MDNNNLRKRVLVLLASNSYNVSEKYNEAFQLYRESEQKDINHERMYNLGFTEMKLENLLYDLQKINGVTDLEIATAKMEEIEDADQGQDEGDENIIKPPLLEDHGDEDLVDVNDIKVNQSDEITGDGTGTAEPEFIAAPTSDERAKLRDDFPFLNDADCPDELKVLVADKITAYKNYVKNQSKLVQHANGEIILNDEELKEVTKGAVEDFELNKEIYTELNYFKDHGKILGNHPIFAHLTLEREVAQMSTEECFNYLNSSKKFISVKTTALEELIAKKPKGYQDKMTVLTAAIEYRKEKVSLVKKHQGISE